MDKDVIGSALRKNCIKNARKLDTHFIFASPYYDYHEDKMRSFILEGMKKYKIQSLMVTFLYMWRFNLITKEAMEDMCNGKDSLFSITISVNDDLESLFEDLRLGKQPRERIYTYFLPKLTEEELELVARKDRTYLKTLGIAGNKDVPEAQMKLSESNSKFVKALSSRKTYTINNQSRCSLQ